MNKVEKVWERTIDTFFDQILSFFFLIPRNQIQSRLLSVEMGVTQDGALKVIVSHGRDNFPRYKSKLNEQDTIL